MRTLLLIIVVVVLASTVNTSCTEDGSIDPLIGSWIMTDGDYSVQITFQVNDRGTITETEDGTSEVSNFTYTVSDDKLSMNIEDGDEIDTWTYTISGRMLTLVSGGTTLVFTSV